MLLTSYRACRLKLVAYQAFEVPDLNLGLGAVFLAYIIQHLVSSLLKDKNQEFREVQNNHNKLKRYNTKMHFSMT